MRVGSLFSGIGGIDLGFIQAGHQILWANEMDRDACKTYRTNFPDTMLIEGDIRKTDAKKLPHVDIITAGFPCQPFSVLIVTDICFSASICFRHKRTTVSTWPEATILILIGLCLFEETYLRFLACSQNYLREHIHVFSRSAGTYRLLPVRGNMSTNRNSSP